MHAGQVRAHLQHENRQGRQINSPRGKMDGPLQHAVLLQQRKERGARPVPRERRGFAGELGAVRELGASRVVIDSLSGFEVALAQTFRDDFRESLYRMVAALTRSPSAVCDGSVGAGGALHAVACSTTTGWLNRFDSAAPNVRAMRSA